MRIKSKLLKMDGNQQYKKKRKKEDQMNKNWLRK
jgi:hypothetical protein